MSDTDERPACLICGRRFDSVGRHVYQAHGISAVDYRDRFRIRRSASLSSTATRELASANLRSRIESGALANHLATNAERAAKAHEAAREARRRMRAAGIDLPHGTPVTPRKYLEDITSAIEGGAIIATAVKYSPISYTAFNTGLARHPDLRARVEAAKAKKRRR